MPFVTSIVAWREIAGLGTTERGNNGWGGKRRIVALAPGMVRRRDIVRRDSPPTGE
jgi:hypothetical protein